MKKFFLLLILFNTLYTVLPAQDTAEYFKSNFLRYEDYVYRNNIKTVILSPLGFEMTSPIIRLNTEDKLLLQFDDLDKDVKDYYYTLIHCTAQWAPSDLLYSQYLSGFPDDRITDYSFSFNTLQAYTHYRLVIPNSNLIPTVSGNYLLLVYSDNDRNNIVLSRRFMITDSKVNIQASVHRASVIEDRDTKQKIDFSVFYDNYQIDNPFGDINIVILQNDRWDNAISTLKPLFLRENQLDYSYETGNDFNGGNEYRNFDIRSLRYLTERVSKISEDSAIANVYLFDDESRSYKRYSTEYDLNGYYSIKTYDGKNDETEPDYAWVHFNLPYDFQRTDGNFYVFGMFSLNQCTPENKMIYNPEKNAYQAKILLKQGYYNYVYVFLEDASPKVDVTTVEGNHTETENDYTILVYHRPTASRYDHLVGIKKINSVKFY
jgi:hypothetical protein